MFNRSRGRTGPGVGFLMALALVVAVAGAVSAPADAARRHHYHHHYRHHYRHLSATYPGKDAALIIDGETGKVLYARHAGAIRHPASLTKLMTLYLLFDALKKGQLTLATNMPVSAHAAAQRPTNLHLRKGEKINVDTAIKAIVVRSANDVAVVIAEAIGGTEAHFAEMMTAKARALGMRNTFYHNASGLPDRLQITTAHDLAILARHVAYDYPQYFHYFATPSFRFHGRKYVTFDHLIGRYRGADGMKTGYTAASGFNLVTSVVRGRMHVIGIVMGGRTARRRDREMVRLLDNTFAAIKRNPTMVAHAQVPWRTAVAMNTVPSPNLAASGSVFALPATTAASVGEGDDEDIAESRVYPDDPDLTASEAPDDRPDAVADMKPGMVPVPRPPMVVASYQAPTPTPRPRADTPKALRPVILGVSGIAKSKKTLGLHDWTIQIGAFSNFDLARTQLAAYAEKSMDILGQAQRIVVPFQATDGQTLYRARFGPFIEREARQICARLSQRGQTCFAAIATR